MEWVKLKTDIINDPKLCRYFSKSECWDWACLICLAAKSRERGVVLLHDDEIAYALRLTDEEWEAFEDKLNHHHMISRRKNDSALVLTNWDRHQYENPSDSPEQVRARVAKHRASKKNTPLETENVTRYMEEETIVKRDVTTSNAPPLQCNAEERRGEEKRREETRGDENASAPANARQALLSLLAAYRSVRFPNEPPYTASDFRAYKSVFADLVADGVTPEKYAAATGAAMQRFNALHMVNPRSVARHITSLLEPGAAIITNGYNSPPRYPVKESDSEIRARALDKFYGTPRPIRAEVITLPFQEGSQ